MYTRAALLTRIFGFYLDLPVITLADFSESLIMFEEISLTPFMNTWKYINEIGISIANLRKPNL